MAWLDEYRARLKAISSSASATRGKSMYDIANSVTKATSNAPFAPISTTGNKSQWDDYNPFEKILHSEALENVLGNSAVHNVIDFISRPGYAVNSLWNEGINQDEAEAAKGNRGVYVPDFDKLADAAHKGWIGESETTGNDIVNRLVPDSQPNVNEAGDWIRALSGFGVSVASDPLSFIPGAAAKSVVKGAAAKAGLDSTKLVKNGVTAPLEEGLKQLQVTGKATVPDNIAEQIINRADKNANKTETVEAVTKPPAWVQPALIDLPERPPKASTVATEPDVMVPGGTSVGVETNNTPLETILGTQGVKPAAEIVRNAQEGRPAAVIKAELTPQQQYGVAAALKGYASSDIKRVLEKFNVITKQGARKSPELKEAQFDSFNIRNAVTVSQEIIRQASASLSGQFRVPKGKLEKGQWNEVQKARRVAMYDTAMPMLKAAEDTLRAKGIEPILGSGKTGLPLSLHDVLSSLPRHHVENYFMTNQKAIPAHQWLQVGEELVKAVHGGFTEAAVGAATKNIAKILASHMGRVSVGKETTTAYNAFTTKMGQVDKTGKAGTIAATERERLMRALIDAAPSMAQKVEDNLARVGLETGKRVKELEINTLKNFAEAMADAGNVPTEILKVVDNLPETVNNTVKQSGQIPPAGAAQQSLSTLTEVVQETLPIAEIQVMAKVGETTAKGKPGLASKEALDLSKQEVKEAFPELAATADMNDLLVLAQGASEVRAMFPHLANKDLRPILLGAESMTKTLAYKYHALLSDINRQFSKDTIQDAFYRVQTGQDELIADATTKQAAVALKQIIDLAFSTDPQVGKLARLGIDPRHMNEMMGHFGAGDKFRFKGDSYAEAMDSWRKWTEVDDPLALLSRTYAAGMGAYAERRVGTEISQLFGSKSYKPGMVTITDTGGKSRIAKVLDPEVYFDEDIAKQLRVLDSTMKELTKPPSTNRVLRAFDAATHMYKTQLTIYRPGHHLRNTYGDTWLGMMDGMYDPKWYKKGLDIMSARSSVYADWDPEAVAKIHAEVGNGKQVASFKWNKNGRIVDVPLNREQAYRMGFANGMYPTYQILEDLGMATNTGFDFTRSGISGNLRKINPVVAAEKMTGGKIRAGDVHKVASKTSELRDHYHRSAHFAYALANNPPVNASSLEDAILKAGMGASQRVRKWHPDGSDYSRFEQNYMRRGMLFYSWMRKAIPLVVESHLMTPGRALLYPKAMYSMAQANGIDLQDGYGDPFPADQLFPSWMDTGSQGPQLGSADDGYFGLKTGVPSGDILDGYFNPQSPENLKNTVMGGLNPVIKAPIEIGAAPDGAFAQDLRLGGAPVKTFSDYLVKQLPNSSLVENLTDQQFPGSSPDPRSNANYEPQLDVPGTGITMDSNAIGIANWLSGLGITDMSKPSYKNSAMKEKQQATAQRVKDQHGR